MSDKIRFAAGPRCRILASVLAGIVSIGGTGGASAGIVDDWIRGFADSEIKFQRGNSNVPFIPIAFADVSFYNDMEVKVDNDTVASFNQFSVSQGAAVPILLGPRDIFAVGEWASWSSFDSDSAAFDSFDVLTVGIPVGWLRQVNPAWQAAAFVMPLGSKSTLPNASWSWQTMGGAFGRFSQREDLWWAFGFFFDVGPGEDTYLPYVGASWEVTEQWTLSAIMPWPAVLYSPTRDTLFRFGASPSGASWSLREPSGEVSFDLDSWDLVGHAGDRGRLAGTRDRPRVESLRPNRNQLPTGNNAIVVSGSR